MPAVDPGNVTLNVNGEPVEAVIKMTSQNAGSSLKVPTPLLNPPIPPTVRMPRRMHSDDRVVVVRAVSSFSVISRHDWVVCRAIGR